MLQTLYNYTNDFIKVIGNESVPFTRTANSTIQDTSRFISSLIPSGYEFFYYCPVVRANGNVDQIYVTMPNLYTSTMYVWTVAGSSNGTCRVYALIKKKKLTFPS